MIPFSILQLNYSPLLIKNIFPIFIFFYILKFVGTFNFHFWNKSLFHHTWLLWITLCCRNWFLSLPRVPLLFFTDTSLTFIGLHDGFCCREIDPILKRSRFNCTSSPENFLDKIIPVLIVYVCIGTGPFPLNY